MTLRASHAIEVDTAAVAAKSERGGVKTLGGTLFTPQVTPHTLHVTPHTSHLKCHEPYLTKHDGFVHTYVYLKAISYE